MVTIKQLLRLSVLPPLETRMLLEKATGFTRAYLVAHDDVMLTNDHLTQYQSMYDARVGGTPMAYILGEKEFLGERFVVSSATLIPRPETELLVEQVAHHLRNHPKPRILEMGTGSGIIAISLARMRPDAIITATDISEEALVIAQQNAAAQNVNIQWAKGSWFNAFSTPPEFFDLIVSNPPYIAATDHHLAQGDLRFEPSHALTDAADGLQALRCIIEESMAFLTPGGSVWLEHGFDQGAAVRDFFLKNGYTDVHSLRDYAQHERISVGIRPSHLF